MNRHFVWDFDGVVTNAKNYVDGNILKTLIALAENGDKIDIATGAGMDRLNKVALPRLIAYTRNNPVTGFLHS